MWSRASRRRFSSAVQRASANAFPIPYAAEAPALSYAENVELRRRYLAPMQKTHYSESRGGSLKMTTGRGQYLYDHNGTQYLDCVNNVCHVGHCHPRVVAAASAQLAQLNTNSRYLHDNIVRLAAEVTETMPDPLSVCIFVNSGSEANDLALRLARTYTDRRNVYCVDGAYHGHTASTLAISPYGKYATGVAEGSVKLSSPDRYRLGLTEQQMTQMCLEEFGSLLRSNEPPAAYIVESLICCGGQVVLPDGYLRGMHELVREHGGLAIADEVQVGFGRVGSHFWAFEAHDAVPDIVTIGKPFGNGFPLAAVVCTPEVAEASRRVEYFNTFGGNPVACAVGLEVLRVIADEGLQQNASDIGPYARSLIRDTLMPKHARIGDVRGMGLIFGVELVKNRTTREPDPDCAAFVMNHMKDQSQVLVSTDGPFQSVIKMKPPLCVTRSDAENLVNAIDLAIEAYERS